MVVQIDYSKTKLSMLKCVYVYNALRMNVLSFHRKFLVEKCINFTIQEKRPALTGYLLSY